MLSSKCIQHATTKYALSFLPCIFADPGDLAVWLLYMPLSIQTSLAILLVLPCPPTDNFLSLHHLCIQGGHLHNFLICSLVFFYISLVPRPFLTEGLGTRLLLHVQSDENVMETYCQHYQHSTQIRQTHRSTGHCTCMVAISESCAEARGLQKPGLSQLTLSAS